jgi:DNA-binding IclR family transcriptional regulator
MGDLAEATHQHVLLAVRDGDQALLLERISARNAMPILYRVGGRLPLHSTGVGLVLLAFADADFQDEYLEQPLRHEPEKTPVSPAALRRTLADVRRDRAVTFRRRVPHPLMSVASPIFSADDAMVAALSVVVPEQQVDPRRLTPALLTTARAISRALGARRAVGLPA